MPFIIGIVVICSVIEVVLICHTKYVGLVIPALSCIYFIYNLIVKINEPNFKFTDILPSLLLFVIMIIICIISYVVKKKHK